MQSIRVDEAAKIDQQIAKWFRALQQLPIKRIAKAWIKGICPKKQANFPYHKKKREREGQDYIPGDIPGWWPPTTECRFVEPDHIKRDGEFLLSRLDLAWIQHADGGQSESTSLSTFSS